MAVPRCLSTSLPTCPRMCPKGPQAASERFDRERLKGDMPRTEVPITGTVLRWAIEESGWMEEELAERLHVDVQQLRAWEEGRGRPSKMEFNRLVSALRRPSALFFMPAPPVVESVMAHFRSAPGLVGHDLTKEESRTLRRAHRLRDLLSWVLREQESPTVRLLRVDPESTSPEAASRRVRKRWGPSVSEQLKWRTASDAFKAYRGLLEDRGIFVWQVEIRGSWLRGFSLWDDLAPLVVVKSGYNFQSRIYTVMHEVGHLLTRSESACQGFFDPEDAEDPAIERWCESFSAAYLLPAADVRRLLAERWDIQPGQRIDDFDLTMTIAAAFKVSGRATAIRLRDLGYADHNLYELVDSRARVVDQPEEGFARSGRRPQRRIREFGLRAPALLAEAADAGVISRKDALDYLNVSLDEYRELERRVAEE